MTQFSGKTADNLHKIRESKPLIHNITNFVVMNYTANVLLAAGASPIMAHADSEVEEMVDLAAALVLNIGTLTDSWVNTMIKAGRRASELDKPIILDPVGAGATQLRTNAVKAILAQTWVGIIRGNASEILALRGLKFGAKGVDSVNSVDEATEVAAELARELGTTLAITGKSDLVTDGRRSFRVHGGHELMPYVTGTGCSASALLGAFHAVDKDPVSAAATGLAFLSVAGETAGQEAKGPGSFMMHLLDALYNLSPSEVESRSRIEKI